MRKWLGLILVQSICILSFQVQGQVNQIKRLSEENATERKEASSASNSDVSADGLINTCAQIMGCYRMGTDVFLFGLKIGEIVGVAFIKHQQDLMDDKKYNPKILSAEFLPTAVYNFDKNYTFLPRMRLTWGLLSTDIRYNHLYSVGEGTYGTLDWQPILLNIFSRKQFYLRIGTGLSHEILQDISFNEHTLSTEILLSEKLRADAEVRFSHDGLTKIYPRIESSLGFARQIGQSSHLKWDVFGGFLYQKYYQSVVILNAQVGIKLLVY